MSDKRQADELTIEELEQLLYLKKRKQRQQRLRRLKTEGRLVEVNGAPAAVIREATTGNSVASEALNEDGGIGGEPAQEDGETFPEQVGVQWRWVANKLLLLIEVVAVVGLAVMALLLWGTNRQLNQEIAEVQEAQSASVALPTATSTPVIGVVVLPSGHKPPVNGRPPEPGEAGNIPSHLLPIIDAYVPPPIPTPGPEQARRIEIPAINIDKPIVQGDDWEQLKKGVGQHIGSGVPGSVGNVVLSAHNDIYGEIFRHLDRMRPGNEIIITTERRAYTYVVSDIQVVDPTDVWVMGPTDHASTTLISCYPYLVNNKRIVVFADLASAGLPSGLSS